MLMGLSIIFNPATGTLAEEAPEDSKLYPAFPNPFAGETNIMFRLKDDGNVRIEVYDMLGRMVETLKNDYYESGYHQVKADLGHLPSGSYMVRLHTADKTEMTKVLVVK
jgi:Secretion system C-terminal sorting domain